MLFISVPSVGPRCVEPTIGTPGIWIADVSQSTFKSRLVSNPPIGSCNLGWPMACCLVTQAFACKPESRTPPPARCTHLIRILSLPYSNSIATLTTLSSPTRPNLVDFQRAPSTPRCAAPAAPSFGSRELVRRQGYRPFCGRLRRGSTASLGLFEGNRLRADRRQGLGLLCFKFRVLFPELSNWNARAVRRKGAAFSTSGLSGGRPRRSQSFFDRATPPATVRMTILCFSLFHGHAFLGLKSRAFAIKLADATHPTSIKACPTAS